MRSGLTVRLLLVALLLAALIWFLEYRFGPPRQPPQASTRVLDIAVEDVDGLSIRTPELSVTIVRTNGTWHLTSPVWARANVRVMDRLLSVLEAIPRREVITAEQRHRRELSLADYGLAKPRARFVVTTPLGRQALLVGDDVPLSDTVFVRRSASDEIARVPRDIVSVIPATVTELRDRALIHGDLASTARVEIHRHEGGFIQLFRNRGAWLIQQPIVARADAGHVARILDALFTLQVVDFVWDPAVGDRGGSDTGVAIDVEGDPAGRIEPYQLGDEAPVRVAVWTGGDEVGQELILGKPDPESGTSVYAKRRDLDAIYTVATNVLGVFAVSVNDLRDRAVFPVSPAAVTYARFQAGDDPIALDRRDVTGWNIVEPLQWKADDLTVAAVIENLSRWTIARFMSEAEADADACGLTRPSGSIEIRSAGADGAPGDGRVLLLGARSAGGETRFAKFAEEDALFEVPCRSIESLGEDPSDPLLYADRTMLAVTPRAVRRIALVGPGRDEAMVVMRDEAGKWQAESTAAGPVAERVVADMLFLVANLRAARIVSLDSREVASYGLDVPRATLTLGLTGEEGIRKKILLGASAGPAGSYASVQGRDAVFILAPEVVDQLTRSLVGNPERPR